MKIALPATFTRQAIAGRYYSRNPTDVTPPTGAPSLYPPVLDSTTASLLWVNAVDGETGINRAKVQYRVSNPSGVWIDWASIAYPGTSSVVTGLTPATPYDFRVINYDNASTDPASQNPSSPSPIQTGTTLGSAQDLQPGSLSLTATTISIPENGAFSVGVTRDGAGVSSPAIEADWAFSGFSAGTPSPANGTIAWAAGDSTPQTISVIGGDTAGSNRTGTLRIVAVRSSSSLLPTITVGQASVTVIESTPPATIKWNPGYYMGSQNPTYTDDRKLNQQIVEQNLVLSSGSNVLGWSGYYFPPIFQATVGVWDFSKIFRDLKKLRGMSPSKRLMITVIPQFYGTVNYTAVVPAPVLADSAYGTSPVGGSFGWWKAQGNSSAVMAWWRPAVMDWVIDMFKHMATTVNPDTGLTLDQDPLVELTSWSELAVGADAGDATYSVNNLVTQYKRLIDSINTYWPHTLHACQNNISQSNAAAAQDLVNYCLANRTGQSGPDTYVAGQKNPALTGGQAACLGVASGIAGFSGPDLRGQIPMVSFTQGPEISVPGRYKMYTPHTFYTQVNDVLRQSHMIITATQLSATDAAIPAYPADGPNTGANPGNWHSFLPVINNNPLTHISLPTSLQ